MKNRIKEIRKKTGLTQVEFGEKIGVKGNTITNYETGLRNPTDAVILSICREFNVNESWLRNGSGEMFIKQTRDEQIATFIGKIQSNEDESFRKRFISMLSSLDEEEWELLEKMAISLHEKGD